jgi:hypothetical protein
MSKHDLRRRFTFCADSFLTHHVDIPMSELDDGMWTNRPSVLEGLKMQRHGGSKTDRDDLSALGIAMISDPAPCNIVVIIAFSIEANGLGTEPGR